MFGRYAVPRLKRLCDAAHDRSAASCRSLSSWTGDPQRATMDYMTDRPDAPQIAAARAQLIAVLEQLSGPPASDAYVAGAVAALTWVLGESAELAPGDDVRA